jgi:hypothetical protein
MAELGPRGRVTDGGIVVYPCVVCGQDTVFNGMCSDCQIDAGRPLQDMAADWDSHIAAVVEQGEQEAREWRRTTGPGG